MHWFSVHEPIKAKPTEFIYYLSKKIKIKTITLVRYSFQNNEPIETDLIEPIYYIFDLKGAKFEVIFRLHILLLIIYYKFMKLFFSCHIF